MMYMKEPKNINNPSSRKIKNQIRKFSLRLTSKYCNLTREERFGNDCTILLPEIYNINKNYCSYH
jgi:hypothetical protein